MAHELTQADLVWNRATLEGGDFQARGDKALASIFRAHNLAMNGGVFHALELLDAGELREAQCGYRYFGLDAAADLLTKAMTIMHEESDLDEWESRLDREFLDLADNLLEARFKAKLQSNPEDFSPL